MPDYRDLLVRVFAADGAGVAQRGLNKCVEPCYKR